MDKPDTAGRIPLADWQVQMLRMTVFPRQPLKTESLTWWADLVGQPPETSLRRPRTAGLQEEGRVEDSNLMLRVEPNRADWVLAPLEDLSAEVDGFSCVGPLQEVLERFRPLMIRWFDFETYLSMQRIAFGAVLLRPVADYKAGLAQLAAYLPFLPPMEGDLSSFLYQINRRRNSTVGIPDLRINRLAKWSVLSVTSGEVAIQPHPLPLSYSQTHYACRLELDVNTVPNFSGELSRDQQPIVFQELVQLAREIADQGDIP